MPLSHFLRSLFSRRCTPAIHYIYHPPATLLRPEGDEVTGEAHAARVGAPLSRRKHTGEQTKIRKLKFHYLTLKAKKKGTSRKEISVFHFEKENRVSFVANDRAYSCVKNQSGEEIRYVFFSKDLERDQLSKKADKFQRA
jgi:hypothetical protein